MFFDRGSCGHEILLLGPKIFLNASYKDKIRIFLILGSKIILVRTKIKTIYIFSFSQNYLFSSRITYEGKKNDPSLLWVRLLWTINNQRRMIFWLLRLIKDDHFSHPFSFSRIYDLSIKLPVKKIKFFKVLDLQTLEFEAYYSIYYFPKMHITEAL